MSSFVCLLSHAKAAYLKTKDLGFILLAVRLSSVLVCWVMCTLPLHPFYLSTWQNWCPFHTSSLIAFNSLLIPYNSEGCNCDPAMLQVVSGFTGGSTALYETIVKYFAETCGFEAKGEHVAGRFVAALISLYNLSLQRFDTFSSKHLSKRFPTCLPCSQLAQLAK
eukprot:1157731-Pelagomonas_calceolata.AAC.4